MNIYQSQKSKEKCVPLDDPIWNEIIRFKSLYIDVDETFKESKMKVKESEELIEEVKLLRSALTVI